MFTKYIIRIMSALGTVIQYSCFTHCALEYVGDFIVVNSATSHWCDIYKFKKKSQITRPFILPAIADKCTGPSMEPTIFSNDILFTEHITPRLHTLKRGDIIIAKCPTNPQQHICKRIAAIEGDKVRHGFTTYTVPNGHLWLEGDNSVNSSDSRLYGPVPQGLVRSRAICRVWPIHDISLLTTTNK